MTTAQSTDEVLDSKQLPSLPEDEAAIMEVEMVLIRNISKIAKIRQNAKLLKLSDTLGDAATVLSISNNAVNEFKSRGITLKNAGKHGFVEFAYSALAVSMNTAVDEATFGFGDKYHVTGRELEDYGNQRFRYTVVLPKPPAWASFP